jgi:uncharacterized integral membrane protein (TIGR00698 family)
MRNVLSGVCLAVAVAIASRLGADAIGIQILQLPHGAISPILTAVLVGALVRVCLRTSRRYEEGYQFCLGTLLRLGIVLLGLRLSVVAAGQIGMQALPVVVACVFTALIVVTLLSRACGLSSELGILVAAGTSICGCTAIVATAPVIRADKQEMTYAVGCITLFGLVAMVLNPFIAHALFGEDPLKAGIFLGTSIHDTAQVVGAGMMYEQYYPIAGVLEAATVTKLVRNLCMLLVIPLLSIVHVRSQRVAEGEQRGAVIPWFVFSFIGLCAVRTIGDIGERPFGVLDQSAWQAVIGVVATSSEWCLAIAMAAVGLTTDLGALRRLGFRPLLLALLAASLVGVLAAVMLLRVA